MFELYKCNNFKLYTQHIFEIFDNFRFSHKLQFKEIKQSEKKTLSSLIGELGGTIGNYS
jgi:hypothetical protein